jgi:hypothetical protein
VLQILGTMLLMQRTVSDTVVAFQNIASFGQEHMVL